MKEYNEIIDSVIKELLPEVIEKYLPNIKYTNYLEKINFLLEKMRMLNIFLFLTSGYPVRKQST